MQHQCRFLRRSYFLSYDVHNVTDYEVKTFLGHHGKFESSANLSISNSWVFIYSYRMGRMGSSRADLVLYFAWV